MNRGPYRTPASAPSPPAVPLLCRLGWHAWLPARWVRGYVATMLECRKCAYCPAERVVEWYCPVEW